jgi:hypothetical protein
MNILQALAVTAEICGTEFSVPAGKAMVAKLSLYPEQQVLKALDRCQNEITGRLSLAAIIDRIEDGRPGVDEAWATAICAGDETSTVVWTEETSKAFWVAETLIKSGDMIGARMAFKDAYAKELINARSNRIPIKWNVSLGHDPVERDNAIKKAANLNLIASEYAVGLLAHREMNQQDILSIMRSA